MRNLDIDELKRLIFDYSLEIEYLDKEHLPKKLNQFMNFLYSQPISQRIFTRIDEDYLNIKTAIPLKGDNQYYSKKEKFLDSLNTPDLQEAFSFFIIDLTYKKETKNNDKYLYLAQEWLESQGGYDEWKRDFIDLIFKPFIKLVNWYIEESQSRNPNDYFSNIEINEYSDKLDDLLKEIRLGQEVLYDDIQNLQDEFKELKDQLKNMKKKNWGELVKGKLIDLVLGHIISNQTLSFILKNIIGQDFKILNN